MDKDTSQLVKGGAEEEARQALKNLGAILNAAGSNYENVVKTTIMLADIETFPIVNSVYKECEISYIYSFLHVNFLEDTFYILIFSFHPKFPSKVHLSSREITFGSCCRN